MSIFTQQDIKLAAKAVLDAEIQDIKDEVTLLIESLLPEQSTISLVVTYKGVVEDFDSDNGLDQFHAALHCTASGKLCLMDLSECSENDIIIKVNTFLETFS